MADLHFGIKSDSELFLDLMQNSLNNFYFPLFEKSGVDTIILAGDIVDRRKYVNYKTAKRMREMFLEPLKNKGYTVYVIPGNHDCYHKNTNETNALAELVRGYDFSILDEPSTIGIYDQKFLFIPWICDENKTRVMKAVSTSTARYLIGHLELQGFEMYRGLLCEHGMDANLFSKFDKVWTGHFHRPSTKGNIQYIGAPWQMTWGDWDDARGCFILDPKTGNQTFHQNPFDTFRKVVYNDKELPFETVMDVDFASFKNAYTKVIVVEKTNPFWFDRFVEELSKHAEDVKIVETNDQILSLPKGDIENCRDVNMDTAQLLANTIENGTFTVDKTSLRTFALDLYQTATNLEI